jgi:hypothetical protein
LKHTRFVAKERVGPELIPIIIESLTVDAVNAFVEKFTDRGIDR